MSKGTLTITISKGAIKQLENREIASRPTSQPSCQSIHDARISYALIGQSDFENGAALSLHFQGRACVLRFQ
jgi:hypothetical protein